jgi:glycogen operon protein
MLTATMLSVGVPMLLMGDEVRRTQHGNNNDYCHDDESNWFDWTLLKRHADVHRFTRLLCERRLLRTTQHEQERVTLNELISRAKTAWHGTKLYQADWGDNSHTISFLVEMKHARLLVHVIFNAWVEALDFELLNAGGAAAKPWRRWIDTSLNSPDDIVSWQDAAPVHGDTYHVGARSTVVLFKDAE